MRGRGSRRSRPAREDRWRLEFDENDVVHSLSHVDEIAQLSRAAWSTFEHTDEAVRDKLGLPGRQTGLIAQEVQEVLQAQEVKVIQVI